MIEINNFINYRNIISINHQFEFIEHLGTKFARERRRKPISERMGFSGYCGWPIQWTYENAINSHSNVYVVDSNSSHVQKFDKDATFLGRWGSNDIEDGQFILPTGIAIDSANNLYVSGGVNGAQKFDSEGKFESK